MTRFVILLVVITLSSCKGAENNTMCDGHQTNFNLKDVTGTWFVVAAIPEKLFPEKQITCYKMEISETDEAGLKWLVNKTIGALPEPMKNNAVSKKNGIIVRQRYYTESPFDVWSKSVEGVNGCFHIVISIDVDRKDFDKTLRHDAMMQLHLLEVSDGSGPYLLQMLWGRMISVVIYRRHQGVIQDQLKPVFEFVNKLRGPQRLPKICDIPLRDSLFQR